MARTSYPTTLQRITALTPTLRELVMRRDAPPEVPFRAGQFIMLHVRQGDKIVKRAYSIASSEENQMEIKLIIKLVANGVASEYVKTLHAGDDLEISGPFGKCAFLTPPPEQVLFLCTGAGLSQHHSMLASQGVCYPDRSYHLYIGVWNESEIFYQEELEALKQKLPNLKFEFILDQANSLWKGRVGYVTDVLESHRVVEIPTHIYLCGNPAMIKSAKSKLLDELGFSKEHLIVEAFN